MGGSPLHLTLARSFAQGGAHYRVLAQPLAEHDAAQKAAGREVAGREVGYIELNRRIELQDGEAFAIERRGSLFAPTHVLVRAASAGHASPVLALLRRERMGWWWHRVLTTPGPAEQRYLLHRRAVFGSPANADLLSSVAASSTAPSAFDLAQMPVVLRVEKSGAWRQRLQARWLDSTRLSLPVVLFVLNVLADQDRRAAIAASAGVAGV